MSKVILQSLMQRKNRHRGNEYFEKCMAEIGNPQNRLNVIHVAGTNGKGSTCHYISQGLEYLGYRVGMFLSPHLLVHYDRIRCNRQNISEDDFDRIYQTYLPQIEAYDLSMFEIDFLIACVYFCEKQVDYAIIETGVGGRFDSTNIIAHSLCSVITTIGFDHTQILGDTLEKIANQKAGIIKENQIVCLGHIDQSLLPIFFVEASHKHSQVYCWKDRPHHFSLNDGYQAENKELAYMVLEKLGFELTFEKINQIFQEGFAGRLQIVSNSPTIVIDGAHNPHGVTALLKQFSTFQRPIVSVVSACKDKDVETMLNQIKMASDQVIYTEFQNERNLKCKDLNSLDITKIPDLEKAYAYAKQLVCNKGTIVFCGSLYFVSELELFFKNDNVKNSQSILQ